jgi:hypothetical protein
LLSPVSGLPWRLRIAIAVGPSVDSAATYVVEQFSRHVDRHIARRGADLGSNLIEIQSKGVENMKTGRFTAIMTSILLAAAVAPALAKTKSECTKEWQASKVAMQAAHKTEKAYVAECRGTAAATTPAAKEKDYGGSEHGRY